MYKKYCNPQAVLKSFVFLLLLFFTISCASYYQRNLEFQEKFEKGEITSALEVHQKNKKAKRKRVKLLYYLNSGMLYHLKGEYSKSVEYFTKADYFAEDFRRNWRAEILASVSNPTVKPYPGEDYEIVLIHYYNALNFLHLNNHEAALIEARRMNLKLLELQDTYSREMVYKRDAFGHNLMGIIYDAAGEYNDAFIAYRNAYNIYSEDYTNFYGLSAPKQLKKDLLRAAHRSGFREDYNFYSNQFNMKYERPTDGGELVVFWDNGLGPVKDEWSINFTVMRGQGGYVTFVNEEFNLSFPFYVGDSKREAELTDLQFVRVAFPKLKSRPSTFSRGVIRSGNQSYELELAQNIDAIAEKSLNDRFLREMGSALLRLALKQITEIAAREVNPGLGLAVSIANAVTEKADTRNWQTLPAKIHYTRISLPEGEQTLSFETHIDRQVNSRPIKVNIRNNRTTFYSHRTFLPRHSLSN